MTLRLSPALDCEFETIAAMVNAAYRGTGEAAGWAHEADLLAGQRTSPTTLASDLAEAQDAWLLVARDEGEDDILGCVWLDPQSEETWYLGMLTVTPRLQDRRLGRTLLTAAEAFAAERGARRMRMSVVSLRLTLIAWYERRGYARTGETAPFPYEDRRFGTPLRNDLEFMILERTLS